MPLFKRCLGYIIALITGALTASIATRRIMLAVQRTEGAKQLRRTPAQDAGPRIDTLIDQHLYVVRVTLGFRHGSKSALVADAEGKIFFATHDEASRALGSYSLGNVRGRSYIWTGPSVDLTVPLYRELQRSYGQYLFYAYPSNDVGGPQPWYESFSVRGDVVAFRGGIWGYHDRMQKYPVEISSLDMLASRLNERKAEGEASLRKAIQASA